MTPIDDYHRIQALFENWSKDPCWDVEFTEGFEAFESVLKLMRFAYDLGHKEGRRSYARMIVEDAK